MTMTAAEREKLVELWGRGVKPYRKSQPLSPVFA